MATYHPDLATQSAPRYTSYPTAADFTSAVGAERQALALLAIDRDMPISLYLHIPYCQEICWYCGCNTGALGKPARLDDYVEALLAEIGTVAALVDGQVASIHLGGGSPNVLSPAQLRRIGDAIRDQFGVDETAEWAMEIDPRNFDVARAAALAQIGVRRVSIGAQTFSPTIQRAIGRVQPLSVVVDAIGLLREAGIRHVNLDLMYGLPLQTCDDIADSIAKALELRPSRIAMFGYANVPGMLPRQRMIDAATLPDAQERFRQSALASRLMTSAGYRPIGFDHFARPCDSLARAAGAGRLRRNFQGFTDDQARTVIGLGASAISQFDGVIVQNEKHVGRYRETVRERQLAGVRGVPRTAEDRLRGAIIERILCDGEIDLPAVCTEYELSLSLLADSFVALAPFEQRGIARWSNNRLFVPDADRCYRRLVAAAFDARRTRSSRMTSVAV